MNSVTITSNEEGASHCSQRDSRLLKIGDERQN